MRIQAPVVIPAYRPGRNFPELVATLAGQVPAIIVVDDGSGAACDPLFEEVARHANVTVLHHAVNLGKGAALKTGMQHALCAFPECPGVVTADADGQHDPEDILRLARILSEDPEAITLGVRSLHGDIPFRSQVGNTLTRWLFRALTGQSLRDTQTGLRAIPRPLLPHLLKLSSSGYEFELDMLMAFKYQALEIRQEPIRTVYLDGNRSSHFKPILDSMRIYFVLLRYGLVSLLTAILDNLVFLWMFASTGSIWQAQLFGRLAAMIFNYSAVRGAVFHSRQSHRTVLPRYACLVAVNGLISYGLLSFLHAGRQLDVFPAKLIAESMLFIANFAMQRDFVFTRRSARPAKTDWDRYYKVRPLLSRLTRRYTASVLLSLMREALGERQRPNIVEFGGANSCFIDPILRAIRPGAYQIFDTNSYGLSLLERRVGGDASVKLHQASILELPPRLEPADLVFSVGLIEHFDPPTTRRAVLAHLEMLKPGGYAIITFPTPTPLYRAARFLLEIAGLWNFPDERPLARQEVLDCIAGRGELIYEKILWPLILTQGLLVIRKRAEPEMSLPAQAASFNAPASLQVTLAHS